MWSHKFDNRVISVSCCNDKVAFGCENGWIYVFDEDGLLWSKKLVSTYYRGPFTDVNVTSLDINDRYLVVGTDFADGKVYLFDLNGKKIWERQLMSILGCWERPEDVKIVKIARDEIAVVSGFVNDRLTIFNLKGETVDVAIYKDFVRCLDADKVVGIGTDKRSEILNVVRFEKPSRDVVVIEDWAFFASDNEVFCSCGWSFKAENPIISANKNKVCFSSKNRVFVCTLDGDIEREITFKGKITDLRFVDGDVLIGTSNGLYVNSKRVMEGKVFKIGDSFVIFEVGKNKFKYISL
ncbi:hypothetical protein [Archaeoglobus sp.]